MFLFVHLFLNVSWCAKLCVYNVCLTGLVTWPNPNEDPYQQVVRRSSPGTLRLGRWRWWSRTSVNWTNALCVCPLFSVSHMHFLLVHLPPTLCDREVSVSAHRAFVVHKVGWHVSNHSGVPVKIIGTFSMWCNTPAPFQFFSSLLYLLSLYVALRFTLGQGKDET